MADSQASAKRSAAPRRRIRALGLRLEGKTYRGTGEAMGVAEQRAHKLTTTELRRLVVRQDEHAERLLRLPSERPDGLLQAVWPAAAAGGGGRGPTEVGPVTAPTTPPALAR